MRILAVFVSLFTICSLSAQAGGPTKRQKERAAKECAVIIERMGLSMKAHNDVLKVTQEKDGFKSFLRIQAEAHGARFAMVVMDVSDFNALLNSKSSAITKLDDLKVNLLFDNLTGQNMVFSMASEYRFTDHGSPVVQPDKWRVAWIFDLSLLDRLDVTLRPDYPVLQRRPDEKLGSVIGLAAKPRSIIDGESTEVSQIIKLQTTEHRHNPMKLDFEFNDPILLSQAVALWIPRPLLDFKVVDSTKVRTIPDISPKLKFLIDQDKFPDFKKIQSDLGL